MQSTMKDDVNARWSIWRVIGWGAAAMLLMLPAMAMHFTAEVNWTASDFVVAAAIIGGIGLAFELAVRQSRDGLYRIGAGVALLAAFLMIWSNLAVGIIGAEGNPANLLYFVMLAIALVTALVLRLRARAIVWVCVGLAATTIAIGAVAVIGGMDRVPLMIGVHAFFAGLWTVAALFFHAAAKRAGA